MTKPEVHPNDRNEVNDHALGHTRRSPSQSKSQPGVPTRSPNQERFPGGRWPARHAIPIAPPIAPGPQPPLRRSPHSIIAERERERERERCLV